MLQLADLGCNITHHVLNDVLPRTVRKALAVLTGMVKSEQVYIPSSASVTSLMLIVNSCDVALPSSIRLSLSAARTNNQQSTINYDKFIISMRHTQEWWISETSPNHPVLNHEYWPANNMWKHRNINKLQFNLKINLKKVTISVYDYVQILCWVWKSILCCRDKIFYDGFQSEGKWNMDQSGFKSNIISVNIVQNEHSSIWTTCLSSPTH